MIEIVAFMPKCPLTKRKPIKRTKSLIKKSRSVARQIKPKKKKLPSLSKLKQETDRLHSLFIRGKYPKVCYTCKRVGLVLQCGHFISRLYLATRWEEDNTRPQCVGCNIWGKGKPLDFEENLKAELGSERVEEMKASRKILIKPTRAFYQEKIAYYDAQTETGG